MQTPGSLNQPQTPMIPMERRMDLAYDRLLSRATEEAQNIERPQVRTLGRIINQLESMNLTMRSIREQIREDVRAKRKYYREEAKILKKDSDNFKGVQKNVLDSLRGKGAAIVSGVGAIQASQGNLGGAAESFGMAGLLMAPEIIEFLTGSVVNALAVKGLIGNRGVGATNITRGVGGASKLKNPLLITAALAASLLIPSLAQAGQSGDKRRQELATKVISGEQTINKPDVTRFRSQLNRFESILSRISFDGKKTKEDTADIEGLENQDEKLKKEEGKNKLFGIDIKRGGIAGIINRFFNKNSIEEPPTEDEKTEKEKNISIIEGNTNLDLASNIEGDIIEGDNIDDSTKISLVQNLSENTIFNDQVSNIFESNEELATDLLPNLDIAQMGSQISSEITNNVIDLPSNQQSKVPSGFVGQSVTPASIFVNTAFKTSGGIIDKFEAASSLRSYGAFS